MSSHVKYEIPPPTAPPAYSSVYPTGQPEAPTYGFQQPVNPQYPQPNSTLPPAVFSPPEKIQPSSTNQQTVIIMGGCPTCRVGVLEDDYTCCGIFCAIIFFPIGILCCLLMKEKRCTSCRATF